jgi:hypothetical protein
MHVGLQAPLFRSAAYHNAIKVIIMNENEVQVNITYVCVSVSLREISRTQKRFHWNK